MNPESQLTMTQAERDAFKNDAATLSLMVSRLESECAALGKQLENVIDERDRLRATLNLVEEQLKEALRDRDAWRDSHGRATAEFIDAKDRLEDERDRLRVALKEATERAEAAERQRDELRANIEVDARVLRDSQVSSLRDQLTAMADARDAALRRADMLERDAAESRDKLYALSAFIRGGVSALVRG